MKILCLHGNGTNSNIMQLQTAPLRHELEDGHEFEFVEAAVEAPMSKEVQALSLPGSSCYAFYDPNDLPSSLRRSISQLDEYVSAEGPFEAVMGFSGGATLAALYLASKQRRKTLGLGGEQVAFKCGIFFSSASCDAEVSVLGSDLPGTGEKWIQIPTVHIWGSNDNIAPTGAEELSRMCDPTQRMTLVHEGGHDFPRGDYLIRAVHVIRRTIDLAETN